MNHAAPSTLHCELCSQAMSAHNPATSSIRYFHCAGCGRWVASSYREDLLRGGTTRSAVASREGEAEFERVKQKMALWMERLDQADPFHVLGVSPSAPEESIHARFRELALQHHPDRGGDPARMRRILGAYETIRRGKSCRTSL